MIGALLDHIWQSTLLALAIGVLTLVFREARASVRHGLWLAASLKFLVPFAALAAAGAWLGPALGLSVGSGSEAVLVAQAAAPFSQSFAAPPANVAPAAPALAASQLALILFGVWSLGCAAVLIAWTRRWADVRAALRRTTPLALEAPMPVLASPSMLEPGLVGLWRPVLVVPDSLFEHLSRPQIEAIVAHETSHFRRRDNLIAAVHMLVEALFWFHPLVWWIGARLIDERERACDEAVVRSGHDRAAYARSLVDCCRLYLQSPLPCVSGASGSRLKSRVQLIMTAPLLPPLSISSKALLLAAGVCALASPVAAGWLISPASHAATASVVAAVAGFTEAPSAVPAELDLASAANHETRVRRVVMRTAPARGLAPAAEGSAPGPAEVSSPNPQPTPDAEQAPPTPSNADAPGVALPQAPKPPALTASDIGPAVAPKFAPAAAKPPVHAQASASMQVADADRILCQSEAITGSRFVKRLCMRRSQWLDAQRRLYEFERALSLDPSGNPSMVDSD